MDFTRKHSDLVLPSDYHSLLVIKVGSDEIEGRSCRKIKRDFRALGNFVKRIGTQDVFSIPSVPGRDILKSTTQQKRNTST